jgi:hypothetical protein
MCSVVDRAMLEMVAVGEEEGGDEGVDISAKHKPL